MLGLGVWSWKDGRIFPRDREITWLIPDQRSSVSKIEIQIQYPSRHLLKREEFFFPAGAPSYLLQKVPLKNGRYRALVFIELKGQSERAFSEALIDISGEDSFTFRF